MHRCSAEKPPSAVSHLCIYRPSAPNRGHTLSPALEAGNLVGAGCISHLVHRILKSLPPSHTSRSPPPPRVPKIPFWILLGLEHPDRAMSHPPLFLLPYWSLPQKSSLAYTRGQRGGLHHAPTTPRKFMFRGLVYYSNPHLALCFKTLSLHLNSTKASR